MNSDQLDIWGVCKRLGFYCGLNLIIGPLRKYLYAFAGLIDLEESIYEKYDIDPSEFDEWFERQDIPEDRIKRDGNVIMVKNIFEYTLRFLEERLGNIPEIERYREYVNEIKDLQKEIIANVKEEDREDVRQDIEYFRRYTDNDYVDLIEEVTPPDIPKKEIPNYFDFAMNQIKAFELMRENYGLTLESLYDWLHSQGIRGNIINGCFEEIPGVEMHLLEYAKTHYGDTQETRMLEDAIAKMAEFFSKIRRIKYS